jgi:hypothetical protein
VSDRLARRTLSRATFRWVVPGSALLVLLAGAGFAALEADAVGSYWRGVWWALSLMTTVGFVGRAPSTAAGQALSAVLMVCGFVLLSMTTAAIASVFVRHDEAPEETRESDFERAVLQELHTMGERLGRLESGLSAEHE